MDAYAIFFAGAAAIAIPAAILCLILVYAQARRKASVIPPGKRA
jgi:hypothetical protein